jgi:hypothetical protein
MNRACHRHTIGFDLPDRRMISAVPQPSANDGGAPHVFLRRAAVGDNRLKPTAIRSGDVHHNSCSHDESLNCFGRLGNGPNESDH